MSSKTLRLSAAAALALASVSAAHAASPPPKPDTGPGFFQRLADAFSPAEPVTTGQPNQSCEDSTTRPGHAENAPGSAFNPDGNAGQHYAGEQPQNSKNPKSVSQYDVACFNVSNRGP